MSNNITPETNFSNVTITNSYPCLVGGTWTASVNSAGVTVYSDGTNTYEGPVNLIGGTLTISSGAVVTNLTAVNSPTITVNSGGTITNSDIFNASVTVSGSGLSENNNYVSSAITFSNNATSSSDYFYYPGTTSTTSGTLNVSGTTTTFQTSDGKKTTITTGASWGSNVTYKDPHFPNINGSNSTTAPTTGSQSIWLGPACEFGNTALVTHTDYSSGTYTISNDNPTYTGGTWTASVNSEGVTVYSNSTGTVTNVEGPINLISITALTITAGAVVDGLTMAQTINTAPTITNYGTIQNSFLTNVTLRNQANGLSQNNTYIGAKYTGLSGSKTSQDVFYSDKTATATLNLSQYTGTSKSVYIDNGSSTINLNAGALWDNSYAGTNPNATSSGQISINRSYGSEVACFLAGTMIQTPNGDIAIEEIKVGDQIVTHNGIKQEIRTIIWKGHNTVTVNPNLKDDQAGYPIRIVKDAIVDGVPSKDMLITPEHCLFFDDKFIPAYMLVNNHTIFYDRSITHYTYYHIETEQHSVIQADGVLTESYLDTGNRHGYYQDHNIVSIHNRKQSWDADAAAPLITNQEVVEVIFNKIVQRISTLELNYTPQALSTTNDHGLYLITDKGVILNKIKENKGKFLFKLPTDTQFVIICSRTSRPSDVIGPFMNDRRELGVLIGNITLLKTYDSYPINTHLKLPDLIGWDNEINELYRWTNGKARLDIPVQDNNKISILVIDVIAGGPYLLETPNESQQPILKAG